MNAMHIHILGICGTFMGGIAAIASRAGFKVTGCDANVYPPMSTQLEALGIALTEGYDAAQLSGVARGADVFVVGNALSRGNPLVEAILDAGLPYQSGPQWLFEHVLHDKWVLAVAGTHGKTTVTSMLAWILDHAGLDPGFLIGGVPLNFGISARLTDSKFFVIEADEYDTAFFDKRSKFVHYRPRTAILNNLEFDHADIFADLSAIETQFHHFVRSVPRSGRLVVNAEAPALARVLARGAWSEVERFAGAEFTAPDAAGPRSTHAGADWRIDDDGAVSHRRERRKASSAGRRRSRSSAGTIAQCARRARGGAPCGSSRGRGHRGAGAIRRDQAPARDARHRGRRHRLRRLRASPDGDRDDGGRTAACGRSASASSRCSSRARTR